MIYKKLDNSICLKYNGYYSNMKIINDPINIELIYEKKLFSKTKKIKKNNN